MTANEIGTIVVDCAVALHKETGPGLLETVYEVVLAHDLEARGLRVQRQIPGPITLRGLTFDEGFRADMIVEGKVLLGYLLNFGDALMRDGIERIVNGEPD